jgi:hypothetical protein
MNILNFWTFFKILNIFSNMNNFQIRFLNIKNPNILKIRPFFRKSKQFSKSWN